VDHAVQPIGIGVGQVAGQSDSRIIDEYGDAGVTAQHLFDLSEIRLVVQVGDDDRDGTPGVIAEASRQCIEPFSIARDEDEVMSAPCQPVGIDRADAGRSARDQRGAARHAVFSCFEHLSPLGSEAFRLFSRREVLALVDLVEIDQLFLHMSPVYVLGRGLIAGRIAPGEKLRRVVVGPAFQPLLGAVVLIILFEHLSELLRRDGSAEQVTNPLLDEVGRVPGWPILVVHTVKLPFLVGAVCRLRLVEQVREFTL